MSKRDRGIAWYSRHEVLEGTRDLPLPCSPLILRGVPHNVSCPCGFPWAGTSQSRAKGVQGH